MMLKGGSLIFRQVKAESDSTLRAIVTKYKWKISPELPSGTNLYGIMYLSYTSTDFF